MQERRGDFNDCPIMIGPPQSTAPNATEGSPNPQEPHILSADVNHSEQF